jgi:hypothetical protein
MNPPTDFVKRGLIGVLFSHPSVGVRIPICPPPSRHNFLSLGGPSMSHVLGWTQGVRIGSRGDLFCASFFAGPTLSGEEVSQSRNIASESSSTPP